MNQIRIPWAEPGGQVTALELFAIDLLRECAVQGGATLLRITWDEAWGIKMRAVNRELARRLAEFVAHLGVVEKAIAKRHLYLTVEMRDIASERSLYYFPPRYTPPGAPRFLALFVRNLRSTSSTT